MSALTHNIGGVLDVLVEAQRGMTEREAVRHLALGEVPDLSLPPVEDVEVDETPVLTPGEARDLLAEFPILTAAGGFPTSHVVFDFDPHQPRDEGGRWTGGGGLDDATWVVARDKLLDADRAEWTRLDAEEQSVLSRIVDRAAAEGRPYASPISHKLSTWPRKNADTSVSTRGANTETSRSPLGGSDALDSIPFKRSEPPPGSSPQMIDALSRYAGLEYTAINAELRAGNDTHPSIAHIDSAMGASVLPSDITVFRGMSGRATFGSAWRSRSMTGMMWRDRGYVSTSASESVARGFTRSEDDDEEFETAFGGTDRVIARIRVPRGARAVQLSGAAAESEILLDRNERFRIVGDRTVGDVRIFDVEVIR